MAGSDRFGMFAILVAHVSVQMAFYDCMYYYIFKVHFPTELSDLERILEYFGSVRTVWAFSGAAEAALRSSTSGEEE